MRIGVKNVSFLENFVYVINALNTRVNYIQKLLKIIASQCNSDTY